MKNQILRILVCHRNLGDGLLKPQKDRPRGLKCFARANEAKTVILDQRFRDGFIFNFASLQIVSAHEELTFLIEFGFLNKKIQ